jgi:hypothetical protein
MSFAELTDDMDAMLMSSLNDGLADYLSATGAVLAGDVEVMLDKEVDRIDTASGMLDRAVTITVRKSLLQPFDRKGAFVLDGKTWHIDGIAEDDGHLITLYVVP